MPVTVHISEDSYELRRALRRWLETDPRIDVVGEASDGAEALRGLAASPPDVALLDLAMPHALGDGAVGRIREVAPDCRVLVLSGSDALGAVADEADGYLTKPAPLPELPDLVCAMAAAPPARR